MRYITLLLLLLTLPYSATAKGFGAESFTLDNGMQVVVIPNKKVPVVSHMVWYKAGAQDEVTGKSGIAHFLEHLMFKGTPAHGQGQLSKMIAKAGGNDNAFTSSDYTAYFQNIARDKLELVMELESDRMQNLLLEEPEVLKERNVILEERSSRIDNVPMSQLKEQMSAALYLNHPYGRPLIGWRHEIEQLSVVDARAWHDNYYTPNNAILVVSGDVTAAELKPLAEKYYGKIPARPVPKRMQYQEPPQIAARSIILRDQKVTQPEWMRYYQAPSQNTDGKEHCFALTLLSYILGDSDTSRLYQHLVVEDQVAASVGSYYDDLMLGPSIFTVYAIPSQKGSMADVQKSVDAQIQNIKDHGITDEELTRAKNALVAQTIYAREDLKTLAYLYGQMVATGVGITYADHWEDNIRAVTAKQIQEAARAILKPERSVTGQLEQLSK